MIGTHSTIIEGKQIIFLNEVVLENNTAKTKVLSNEFKDLITEPNLIQIHLYILKTLIEEPL